MRVCADIHMKIRFFAYAHACTKLCEHMYIHYIERERHVEHTYIYIHTYTQQLIIA
jgi:hypothetical protein